MSENKKGHDPILIANYFIELKPPDLYLLKLLKLCYLAHGFTLAVFNKPLSKEPALAWPYGPVFESIFLQFRQDNPLNTLITQKAPCDGSLSSEEKEIIEIVNDKYGLKFNGRQLSALTHKKDTPWAKAKKELEEKIRDEDIRIYYQDILKQQ